MTNAELGMLAALFGGLAGVGYWLGRRSRKDASAPAAAPAVAPAEPTAEAPTAKAKAAKAKAKAKEPEPQPPSDDEPEDVTDSSLAVTKMGAKFDLHAAMTKNALVPSDKTATADEDASSGPTGDRN